MRSAMPSSSAQPHGKRYSMSVTVLGVVGQLVFPVPSQPQILGSNTQVNVPLESFLYPKIQPFQICSGLDEELHLHLLELASSEGEVAGVISLRKDLPI